ncbi:hypothetical protein ACTSEZ_17300 [Metabacillus sp. JX24]|uniref:hypothetical protein n=1 Tax=Metabacillus sp. JX24 TaxID=3240759 RepID=UPI0035100853
MRQLIGAVYISFGIFFYLLGGMEGYIGPDNMNWIIFCFVFAGLIYLLLDIRDFIKKKLEEK